jgi:hypothetical protein
MAGTDSPLDKKDYFPQFTGYFNQSNTIEMYDNLISQQFQIAGLPVDYIPCLVDPNKDRIFGEDTLKKYLQKYKLTTILRDGQVQETLLYNSFGSINISEFSMYLHIGTFKAVVGKDRDPKPQDMFFFAYNNSLLGFEVMHVGYSTLGTEGNVLGARTCYELVCREREVSEADEGIGETYGATYRIAITSDLVGVMLYTVTDKYVVQAFVPRPADVGSVVTILSASAPADVLVPDGTGRIKEKYQVKGKDINAQKGDNAAISDICDEKDGIKETDPLIDVRPDGNVVPRDRSYWGGW